MNTEDNRRHQAEEEERKALYETSDARVLAVLMVGLFIVVALVGISVGGWYYYQYYVNRAEQALAPYPQIAAPEQPLPPEPRLQVSPTSDLAEMRERERFMLSTYGWADETSGIIRIPIEEAITRVAERGLPVRRETQAEMLREEKELQPTQFSSGRVWEKAQP